MKRIKDICILGGGTAGFTVSSMLARYRELSGVDFNIKLIHNKNIWVMFPQTIDNLVDTIFIYIIYVSHNSNVCFVHYAPPSLLPTWVIQLYDAPFSRSYFRPHFSEMKHFEK